MSLVPTNYQAITGGFQGLDNTPFLWYNITDQSVMN
jgi:hypothetical protein